MGCVQQVAQPLRWQPSATAPTPRAPSSRRFPGDGREWRLCRQPGLEAPLALFLDRIDPVMGFGLDLAARPACLKQREFAPDAAAPVAKAPDGCTGRYRPSTSATLWGRSAGLGARICATVSMGPRPRTVRGPMIRGPFCVGHRGTECDVVGPPAAVYRRFRGSSGVFREGVVPLTGLEPVTPALRRPGSPYNCPNIRHFSDGFDPL
jgi:hypothetical protein